MHGSVNVKTEV